MANLISKTQPQTFPQEGGAQDLVCGDARSTALGRWASLHPVSSEEAQTLLRPQPVGLAVLLDYSFLMTWRVSRDKWPLHTQGARLELLHPGCQQHTSVAAT